MISDCNCSARKKGRHSSYTGSSGRGKGFHFADIVCIISKIQCLISENDRIGLLNTYNEIVERIWRSS